VPELYEGTWLLPTLISSTLTGLPSRRVVQQDLIGVVPVHELIDRWPCIAAASTAETGTTMRAPDPNRQKLMKPEGGAIGTGDCGV